MKDIENFFIDNSDIFDHDEIPESDRRFIMDLIDSTNFIADTKKSIEDTDAAKIKIVDPTVKQKKEKKSRIQLTRTKNNMREEMKVV